MDLSQVIVFHTKSISKTATIVATQHAPFFKNID